MVVMGVLHLLFLQSGINMKDEFYYYSHELGGFIWSGDREIYEKKGTFPSDCVELTVKEWQALLAGQSAGKQIVSDKDGYPVLKEPSVDYVQLAEQKKKKLISNAMQSVAVIQLKQMNGRALTDDERERLEATLDYIEALEAINPENAPDVNWPDQAMV